MLILFNEKNQIEFDISNLNPHHTNISYLKKNIIEKYCKDLDEEINLDTIILLFSGLILENNFNLIDYKIDNDSIIQVHFKNNLESNNFNANNVSSEIPITIIYEILINRDSLNRNDSNGNDLGDNNLNSNFFNSANYNNSDLNYNLDNNNLCPENKKSEKDNLRFNSNNNDDLEINNTNSTKNEENILGDKVKNCNSTNCSNNNFNNYQSEFDCSQRENNYNHRNNNYLQINSFNLLSNIISSLFEDNCIDIIKIKDIINNWSSNKLFQNEQNLINFFKLYGDNFNSNFFNLIEILINKINNNDSLNNILIDVLNIINYLKTENHNENKDNVESNNINDDVEDNDINDNVEDNNLNNNVEDNNINDNSNYNIDINYNKDIQKDKLADDLEAKQLLNKNSINKSIKIDPKKILDKKCNENDIIFSELDNLGDDINLIDDKNNQNQLELHKIDDNKCQDEIIINKIKSMGFYDETLISEAIKISKNNINMAIEYILKKIDF